MRPILCLLGVAASAALLLSMSGAAVSASTASSLSFTDPTGDASGAPDIANVAVTGNADTGTVSFSVTAPGSRASAPDGRTRVVEVLLDTDNDDATGSPA